MEKGVSRVRAYGYKYLNILLFHTALETLQNTATGSGKSGTPTSWEEVCMARPAFHD